MDQNMYFSFVAFLHSLHHPSYETKDGKHHQWPQRKMIDFCEFLGNPQNELKIIHVAGTNGKGSCVSIISSYLQLSGFKVGVYMSPEVLDIKERIQINGELISMEYVELFYEKVIKYSRISVYKNEYNSFDTYSQVLVALAFSYFNSKKVDYAIIETGIGGEFDPTNIVTPILSVITSIGYDHTALLGHNLEKIAKAKCGIIKKKIPVVVGRIDNSLKKVFSDVAKSKQSSIFYTDENNEVFKLFEKLEIYTPYQQNNADCCWLVIGVLSRLNYISKPNIRIFMKAMSEFRHLNNLRGRWEQVYSKPDVILDICDNELGARCVFKFIANIMKSDLYDRLIIIMGLTGPSKIDMLKYFPSSALYYYTQSHGYISADRVKALLGYSGECYQTPTAAIKSYLVDKRDSDLVLVVGSIHIISDAILFFDKIKNGEC